MSSGIQGVIHVIGCSGRCALQVDGTVHTGRRWHTTEVSVPWPPKFVKSLAKLGRSGYELMKFKAPGMIGMPGRDSLSQVHTTSG